MKKKLLGRILTFIKEEGLISKGDRILIAISGGPDSVFMVEMFRDLSRVLGIYFECAHINHGLRGNEAHRDEEFVRVFCKERNIHLTVGKINDLTPDMSGIEELARERRYELLDKIRRSRGLDLIATGHTLDDSAETIIHNLLRGTGLKGLSGILPKRGKIIRPILVIRKNEVEMYLKSIGVEFVSDSSNFDLRFTRNYIRHRLIPLFKHINPEFSVHLFRTGLIVKEHFKWVEQAFGKLLERTIVKSSWVDVYKFNNDAFYHPDVLLELLRLYSNSFTYEESRQFLNIVKKGRGDIKIRGVIASYSRNELAFMRKNYNLNFVFRDRDDTFYEKDFNYMVTIYEGSAKSSTECNIDYNMFPFIIRNRRPGDRVGTKKLKDRFIALKIPYWRRAFWPVFEKDGEIFFVPGIYKKRGLKGNLKLEVKKYEGERFSIFD